MKSEPELRITGAEVSVRSGRRTLARAPLGGFVTRLASAAGSQGEAFLPRGVRFLRRARGATALAIEMPPQARTVRWIAEDSPAPFGSSARYRECHLAFPYLVLLLVIARGRLTGQQQLYYRVAPLESEDEQELLLPNLYNVAEGYGQRCWVCLQHLALSADATLASTAAAAVDHVFSAAFNRSSDVHEGNSYWEAMRGVDPRVASLDAWERATRESRWFPLQVAWRPAETTVGQELQAMLERVAHPLPEVPSAVDLANFVTGAAGQSRRRKS